MIDSRNDTERVAGCLHGVTIDAEVRLCRSERGSVLRVRLHIGLPDVPLHAVRPKCIVCQTAGRIIDVV